MEIPVFHHPTGIENDLLKGDPLPKLGSFYLKDIYILIYI